MFNNKEKDLKTDSANNNARNIFSSSTKLVGEIQSDGDFRVDGNVKGALKTLGKLVVGKNGVIEGDVKCQNAEIEGTIIGEVVVNDLLVLKSTCTVEGQITVARLSVEPGSRYNGKCVMTGTTSSAKKSSEKAAVISDKKSF